MTDTVWQEPKRALINVDLLKVYTKTAYPKNGYQRDVVPKHTMRQIPYNVGFANTISVSMRDGVPWIVDGMQRHAYAKDSKVKTMWCYIYEGLTLEQESELFDWLQKSRKNLLPLDRFNGRVTRKDPVALQIERVIRKHGKRRLGKQAGPHTVTCYAVDECAQHCPEAFERMYPVVADACEGSIIHNLVLMGLVHLDHLEVERIGLGGSLSNPFWADKIKQLTGDTIRARIGAHVSETTGSRGGAWNRQFAYGAALALNHMPRIRQQVGVFLNACKHPENVVHPVSQAAD